MPLYIVPVPIGNLGDITFRAVETLKKVDFIAVEDTRYSLKLLNSLNIKKKLYSYFRPKEEERSDEIIRLLSHSDGALITDSGTPLISDPGLILVRKAIHAGIDVISLPGPTAFVPALTNSGLPSDMFMFAGFSPRRPGKLISYLEEFSNLNMTLIFYESPRRVEKFLEAAFRVFGDRCFSISKELTKRNETVIRGNLKEYKDRIKDVKLLGEFVIVIEGNSGERTEEKPELGSVDDIYTYFIKKYGMSKNSIKKVLMRKG